MPSEFLGSPKILKGALAIYEPDDPGTSPLVIVFQYNPNQVSRTLSLRSPPRDQANAGQAREDILRVTDPPVEKINISIELDAVDQLEFPDQNSLVAENGLHPVLASLEMLLYPASVKVSENEQRAADGEVQIGASTVRLVLLVLGRSRVVPVALEKFSVTEQAFDRSLNPIQAKVDLGMRVLTYMELNRGSLGSDAYLAFQSQKESLAAEHYRNTTTPDFTNIVPNFTASS